MIDFIVKWLNLDSIFENEDNKCIRCSYYLGKGSLKTYGICKKINSKTIGGQSCSYFKRKRGDFYDTSSKKIDRVRSQER